ncbi:MAG: NAD(P)/FAD-dependent oxidoreductase [Stomatobaculum sp.]|nr:NAD(P)/FAD-dependent oxidoreductase [Stomatobaculum sp.]
MKKVIVIGGGAAGMLAAQAAAEAGARVTLLEKNEKLGKKLFITGKGRCNLTNAADMQTVMANVMSNPRFLYSAFSEFTNRDIMKRVEDNGCPLKTERGNRVFPVSDHSSDVIAALERGLRKAGVRWELGADAAEILTEEGKVTGVKTADGKKYAADAVILATGGLSYATTGSDGKGHKIAASLGHRVTDMYPSLVPLVVKEQGAAEMQGLSLKNIEIAVYDGKKEKYREFGEMLFTHFGVSGPVILSASAVIGPLLRKKELKLCIDLKPALTEEQLDQRILRDFSENLNRELRNSLSALLPAKMIPEVIAQSGIAPERRVHDITREERAALVRALKKLTFTLIGLRGYNEAVITKGGVSVKEVNPSTMESKKVQGLYFAGELLDLDAMTGGFNLQIAWSTGYLAGKSAAAEE